MFWGGEHGVTTAHFNVSSVTFPLVTVIENTVGSWVYMNKSSYCYIHSFRFFFFKYFIPGTVVPCLSSVSAGSNAQHISVVPVKTRETWNFWMGSMFMHKPSRAEKSVSFVYVAVLLKLLCMLMNEASLFSPVCWRCCRTHKRHVSTEKDRQWVEQWRW